MNTIENKSILNLSRIVTFAFFSIAIVEFVAEYLNFTTLIWITKPLLMPILIGLYCITSKKINYLFLVALVFNWFANVFFILDAFNFKVIGSILFLVYRLLILYIVYKLVKIPSYLPIIIGSLPFLFIYLYIINIVHDSLGKGVFLFVTQGVFMVILGGYSLGNFIFNNEKSSVFLLLSTLFFALVQFILSIKSYYLELSIFQAMAMVLFVLGQYFLYRYIILCEEQQHVTN